MSDEEIKKLYYYLLRKFTQCKKSKRNKLFEKLYLKYPPNKKEILIDAYLRIESDENKIDWVEYRTLTRWRKNEIELQDKIYL